MKRFRQDFIIGNKFLGSCERNGQAAWHPRGYAFFCDHCAELWARCPLTDLYFQKPVTFQVLTHRCSKHPYEFSSTIAGELFLSWDRDFSDNFPDEVVRYEFTTALKHFEEQQ